MNRTSYIAACLAIAAICLAGAGPACADRFMTGAPNMMPPQPDVLKRAGFDQKLNGSVPMDLVFRDESGQPVKLSDLAQGRPVVLNLVYFECPMLCTEVLNGVLSVAKQLKFTTGQEYVMLTVSFDPGETPELAAAKKANYVEAYGRPGAEKGWHFLTGDEASIAALTDAVGFKYKYDEETDQFAHASGIIVLTPQGAISHYFFGVYYPAPDLRLALVEASEGKIGTPVDQIMLFCYQYDPKSGKYTAAIMNMVRAGGVMTLAALALIVVGFRRSKSDGAAKPPPGEGG